MTRVKFCIPSLALHFILVFAFPIANNHSASRLFHFSLAQLPFIHSNDHLKNKLKYLFWQKDGSK